MKITVFNMKAVMFSELLTPWSMLLGSKNSRSKVKSGCCTKLAEFRKISPISSIFIKTFYFFLVKDLFHLIIAFESKLFLLGCNIQKIDDHFQRSLWPIFIILSKCATILENDNWCQLSPKKNWAVLMKIEGTQCGEGSFFINPCVVCPAAKSMG